MNREDDLYWWLHDYTENHEYKEAGQTYLTCSQQNTL